MQRVDLGVLLLHQQRKRGRIADERAEGAGVEQAHDPVVLALEDHRLLGKRGFRARDVVHAEPGGDGCGDDERHPDETRVLQPEIASIRELLRRAAERAEHAHGDHERHDELDRAHAKVAETGIEAERTSLLRLGEEKADVRHRGGEVAAAEAAEQRQQQKHPVRRARVLHGEPDADRRDQERGGRDRGPAPAAEDRHHEAVEDAQGSAREPGQGGKPEQLVGAVGEARPRQVDHDRAPDHPDRERQQQRRDRDPQVAACDRLAAAAPEALVLGAPVDQYVPGRRDGLDRHCAPCFSLKH